MRLERLAKDPSSGDDSCPSVYVAEDGSLVVLGDLLDGHTYGNLQNVLPGEGAVRIKAEVVVEAVRRYRAR